MARAKQPVPVRRATSYEYTGKHDRSANGKDMAEKGASADRDAPVAARADSSKDSGAGALQLLICVAGIYGSL